VHKAPVLGQLSNTLTFDDVLGTIRDWCDRQEAEEAVQNVTRDRYPIVISVENNAHNQKDLEWMATKFNQYLGPAAEPSPYDHERKNRLLNHVSDRPSGSTHINIHAPLRTFVGKKGMRRIIIKSNVKATDGHTSEFWDQMVVLTKDLSPSVAIPQKWNSWQDAVSDGKDWPDYAKIKNSGGTKNLEGETSAGRSVRVYPNKMKFRSQNYAPYIPWSIFDKNKAKFDRHIGPQMVCLNWQGRCAEESEKAWAPCTAPRHREIGGHEGCPCKREYAWSLELAFNLYGEDGYMFYSGLSEDDKKLVKEMLATPE